jgi:hypothetical protein
MSRMWSEAAGRSVEVDEMPPDRAANGQRKPRFQAEWVKLPTAWIVTLRQTKSISAVQLAMEILSAEFRRKHTGREIVLSAAMTGMPRTTRNRAARELARLGLIEVEMDSRQATRVVQVHV